MSELGDFQKELIDRCKKGDIKAQYSVYKSYSKVIYSTAMRFLNNKMDADEIVQDTFVQAFKKLDTFEGKSTFGYWLKRIAINNSLSYLRKRKIHFEDIEDHQIGSYDEEINENMDPAIVHAAIKELPDGARSIINLYALEGFKHKEIGSMLGITESTSKTQYKRAKQLLLEILKEKTLYMKIEDYLKKNKGNFDVENPDEDMLWEGIRKEILSEKKTDGFNFWKIAAIIILALSVTYVLYSEITREESTEFHLGQIDESLGLQEDVLQRAVNSKMEAAKISSLEKTTDNEILIFLLTELSMIDSMYFEAITDLRQNGYMEQTVNIVFDTYEKRIRILEQIILESQKLEKNEIQNEEISL